MNNPATPRPEPLENFQMWYVRPFNFLRHRGNLKLVEEWDGGFISIMIGSALMERYYRRLTNTHHGMSKKQQEKLGLLGYDDRFKHCAAHDLKLPIANVVDFYRVFRNGVMHQGMPRTIVEKDDKGTVVARYSYEISAGLSPLPTRTKNGINIQLFMDPWAFTETMINLFLSNPDKLDAEFDHGLAEIYSDLETDQ